MDPIHVKSALYQACKAYVAQRIATAKEALAEAKEAAAEETKSSAGDKYETGRAMAQLDEERALGQLAEANKLADALATIPQGKKNEEVQPGSLVITPQGHYFMGVSVGKVTEEGQDYFVIAPSSPIGQVLLGAKPGETVSFQGRTIAIQEVY